MLQAHKQLAASIHAEAVYSLPLVDAEENAAVGAIVMSGSKALMSIQPSPAFHQHRSPVDHSCPGRGSQNKNERHHTHNAVHAIKN